MADSLRQATIFEEAGKIAVAIFREKTPLGLIAMREARARMPRMRSAS